ncbi:MHS family MFS transporter [Amycolatopsis acidicola]|uniref:Putative proline/betaine transporter n=1 Tax=Amycolatopsis acidicola TaxID=2596893 RepID=A0A5N0UYE1_9PSEU|nr:MFS transporter [Amycolatopsis acidicola]KAA9157469.1 MHS family MFS transporter [Amycolatopsis acidicola]
MSTTATPAGRIAAASFVGTAIEWYDYFIYGTASALVFNEVFFPDSDPLVGTLLSFATLAVGFIVRPLGAIVFGHFGDRWGRKSTLVVTLLAMGIATFLIGVLPTYATIGVAAPILLVVLRLLQGLAVGGEWGGAVLIATENAPERKKTLYGSFAQFGSPGGLLVATVVFTVLSNTVSADSLQSWAWRIPFLLSALLVPLGLFIRLKMAETPEYAKAAERQEQTRVPFLRVLTKEFRPALIGTLSFTGVFLTYYLLTSFVLTYATKTLGMPTSITLPANLIAAVSEGAFIYVGVLLAKRMTARGVAIVSAFGLLLWAAPAFALMHTREPFLLYVAVGVAMVFVGTSYGVLAGEVAELFTREVRYTGTSLCYHLAGMIGGGFGPIIATYLLSRTGSSWPVAALTAVVSLLMALACFALPKRESVRGRTPAKAEASA